MVCTPNLDYYQTPRESQIKNSKAELGEDDEKLEHMEKLLHSWIATVPYFPKNYDQKMVRNFLRFAKYNLDKTKQKLEIYYMMKNKHPELLANRNPMSNEITSVIDNVHTVVLPNYTEKCERIFLMGLNNLEVEAFQLQPVMKYVFMYYDLLLTLDHPVSCEILILDASGFTPAHVPQFMSPGFRNAINILIKAYTFRLKEIHIVNAPSMIEKIVAMVKTVLHEKIRKRFIIHKSIDTLVERFSEKLLPKEYGGCLKSIGEHSQECLKMIQKHAEWYQEQESAVITENIPQYREVMGDLQDMEGLHGSFRKINID